MTNWVYPFTGLDYWTVGITHVAFGLIESHWLRAFRINRARCPKGANIPTGEG